MRATPCRTHLGVATSAELPRIVEMKRAMFVDSGRGAMLSAASDSIVLADYRRLYEADAARHFVARCGGRLVACVGAFIKDDLPFRYFDPPRYGFIGDVYTEPAHRGRGLATRLSAEALSWLRGKGIKTVRLLASEAGRPLYAKLGFRPSDEMVLSQGADAC